MKNESELFIPYINSRPEGQIPNRYRWPTFPTAMVILTLAVSACAPKQPVSFGEYNLFGSQIAVGQALVPLDTKIREMEEDLQTDCWTTSGIKPSNHQPFIEIWCSQPPPQIPKEQLQSEKQRPQIDLKTFTALICGIPPVAALAIRQFLRYINKLERRDRERFDAYINAQKHTTINRNLLYVEVRQKIGGKWIRNFVPRSALEAAEKRGDPSLLRPDHYFEIGDGRTEIILPSPPQSQPNTQIARNFDTVRGFVEKLQIPTDELEKNVAKQIIKFILGI